MAITIVLSATDADGDTLSYLITGLPTATLGAVSVGDTTLTAALLPYTVPDNGATITFTPTSTAHGNAAIKFKANDGTNTSAEATVTVLVNRAPIEASTTTFTTLPSTNLKMTLPAQDPDSDAMTYKITSLPGHGRLKFGTVTLADNQIPYSSGTAALSYVPDTGYHGQDRFTFTASDPYSTSDSILVVIEVNTTPVPKNISATVLPDDTEVITFSADDADKDPVIYVIASLPAHGTLYDANDQALDEGSLPYTLSAGVSTLLYAVTLDYRGTDSFHYRAKDSVATSDRAVVTIAVNTPPAAPESVFIINKGGSVQDVLAPADTDGDALTVSITSLPANGSLTVGGKAVTKTGTSTAVPEGGLAFMYTPTSTYTGEDGFTWTANDTLETSDAANVSVIILAPTTNPSDTDTDTDANTDTDTNGGDQDTTDSGTTDTTDSTTLPQLPFGLLPLSCAPVGSGVATTTLLWGLLIAGRPVLRRRFTAPGKE